MAAKKKTTKSKKKLDVKVRMIGELIDATGSSKDSWNPAEISDDMKAISYIRKLADTWNPAQLNEALKYLGFKTVDTWNLAELEETKNKLVKYFLPTDASGNPIELDLKGVFPYEVTALTIDLLPVQDLHGYDNPWAGGAGKNRVSNVTYYSQSTQYLALSIASYDLVAGKRYVISFKTPNSEVSITRGNPSEMGFDSLSTYSFTCDGTRKSMYGTATATTTITSVPVLKMGESGTASGLCSELMIEQVADDVTTPSPYEPYSNICPITGRDSVKLTVNGDDTEITFENTVYGGNVNVLEGGTSSTYGYIASYDGEELPGAWISDRDAYTVGTDPTTGAAVAYVLATPETLTTPANEIALVNGVNTLSTDGDNINITYKANLNS